MGICKKLLFLWYFPEDTDFLLNCLRILPIFTFHAYSDIQLDITFSRNDIELIFPAMNQKFRLVFRSINFLLLL